VDPLSVIVVEDEAPLLKEVLAYLSARGMVVRGAATGDEFWTLFAEARPDAVVLDLGLPGEDGVAIAATVRQRAPDIGIVMMTARGNVRDRIAGYETGADVYLVKPVDLGELIATIRATQRRFGSAGPNDPVAAEAWVLNLTSWRLTSPEGRSVRLTRSETRVLDCLTEEPGIPVTRTTIGLRLGKSEDLSDHRFVDQVVRRLRRKIEVELECEAPIGSAYSEGYYWSTEVDRT